MKIIRNIALFLAALLVAGPLVGQEMSVKSFELREKDLNAKVNPVFDLNGEECALVRVQIALSGVVFEGMVMGQPKEMTGEYFVYMPTMARSLRIKADGYLPLEYTFPFRLEKLRTYGMRILLPGVPDAGELPRPTAQYVVMNVQPKEAMVIIDNMPRALDANGALFLELPLGEHTYQISASGCRSKQGTFALIDTEKTMLNISLAPATGWVNVQTTPAEGVQVLVDGNSVGTAPCRLQLSGGEHQLQLLKAGYLAYNQSVRVVDGETINVQAALQINSSQVTLKAANPKAEIWVSGQKMGVGVWAGPLDAGTYSVESRCEGYENRTDVISVRTTGERSFQLSEQQPIYGVLKVTSSPMGADIYLDGKKIGQTPYLDSRILVGRHAVAVVKTGCRTEGRTVELKKGVPCDLELKLTSGRTILPTEQNPLGAAVTASTPAASTTQNATGEVYKVGDYYAKGDLRGIVFWVDATGRHGKIVSMVEQRCAWDNSLAERVVGTADLKDGALNLEKGIALSLPLFFYCKSQGEGWYVPAKEELVQLYRAKSRINPTLKKMAQPFLSSWYWSSSEVDSDQVWCMDMAAGVPYKRKKDVVQPVRLVAKF